MSKVELVRSHLQDFGMAANVILNQNIKKQIKAGKSVHAFGFGQSPFPVMEEAIEALREHAEENEYVPVAGIPLLRQAISDFHFRYDKIRFSPDNIIVGPGSKELIYALVNVFGGDILVISPSWTTYKPQTQLANQRCVVLNTTAEDEWRVTPEIVEKAMEDKTLSKYKLLILCNPDNPTGTHYTEEHLADLTEVFRKHNILVLSDEIYGRLCFNHKHVCMSKVYPEGAVISTGLSKCASVGGWRVGYHVFPDELKTLKDAVECVGSNTNSCACTPVQYALAKMLNCEEKFDQYLNHTTRIMAKAGDYAYKELTAAGVEAVKPYGGYYLFPDFGILKPALAKRGITTGNKMCEAMFKEKSIVLMAGGPAFLRPESELTTRLCYVNFDGKKALQKSREIGLDKPLPEDFIKEQCSPLYHGIQAIVSWVSEQKED
ncbi:aspartate aminotransferase-like [Octopus vulgaris]|uniref:Aspartate aminotransferase-like n=1 Tax=Octopus vulgaris TaxID=6645 RepID=A0AA36FDG7_OCTVU|nr:aspartate aminotransferase-like [Octopus vulgaris]